MAWLGNLPIEGFGFPRISPYDLSIRPDPATAPVEPFVFGAGGARRSPDEIAAERQLAARQMAAGADYSPIASPWQGLARVAQGITGALEARKLDREQEANAAAANEVASALLSGGASNDVVSRALLDPSLPEEVRQFAQMQYKQMHPTPQQPTEFERALVASGVQPGTPEWQQSFQRYVENKTDPETVVTLPGGGIFIGPRSELSAALSGGGDPASSAPGGVAPPKTLPPDFDFDKGGPTPSASGGFR
ncbi:hypothetical protein LZK98_11910 [Sphingomonas cannabina]|uniref:hypothetical protein n=1 Tax=Sphingomonas cannabina TaxID=2899123 RepID=UPI001F45D807|nr:hypothetical protein [Sphingomonas cannabina]UIJ43797.1 hypothetical protein LZK98_11910 [Sphingomonas cannabina]